MATQIRATKTTAATFSDTSTLADLRELVGAAQSVDGSARLHFDQQRGQRDSITTTVTIGGAA